MELKVIYKVLKYDFWNVSIAPLWNWKEVHPAWTVTSTGFNRTFMELKDAFAHASVFYYLFQSHLYGIESIEPTKAVNPFGFQSHLYGIESALTFAWNFMSLVSIAPLWNWKSYKAKARCTTSSFNRTFMELKAKGTGRIWQHHQFQSHLYGIESSYKFWC